jgi:hypothetical protein
MEKLRSQKPKIGDLSSERVKDAWTTTVNFTQNTPKLKLGPVSSLNKTQRLHTDMSDEVV